MRIAADNVRLGFDGDVEVRFEGASWVKLTNIKRSDLKVKLTHQGSRLRLNFSQKF
ncbi:MAG: hypothetical protein OEU50_07920 [Gammaproteobacteria bacterium]|nr:hypothetical protein [Gammaproteobacteria bacterium]